MRAAVLLVAALVAAGASAQEGVAVVHLADGQSLPLSTWTFAYEYQAWKQGTSAALTQPDRRETKELWLGKKALSVTGATLSLKHRVYTRGDGTSGALIESITLTAGDKPEKLKHEPPHKDLLLPENKGLVVQPRALDLRGETFTGTRRSFCLLSYGPLVECSAEPGDRVVKVEFPK